MMMMMTTMMSANIRSRGVEHSWSGQLMKEWSTTRLKVRWKWWWNKMTDLNGEGDLERDTKLAQFSSSQNDLILCRSYDDRRLNCKIVWPQFSTDIINQVLANGELVFLHTRHISTANGNTNQNVINWTHPITKDRESRWVSGAKVIFHHEHFTRIVISPEWTWIVAQFPHWFHRLVVTFRVAFILN